jgi:ERCC4-type nuclease
VLAKRLLNAFGTIRKVFSASERESQDVDGMGKKSRRIREVVTAKHDVEGSRGTL